MSIQKLVYAGVGVLALVAVGATLLITHPFQPSTGTSDSSSTALPSITVSKVQPVGDTNFYPKFAITGNAKRISKVEFLVDGVVVATNDKSPYSTKITTTSLKDGQHTLIIRVIGKDGHTELQRKSVAFTIKHAAGATPAAPGTTTPKPTTTATTTTSGATVIPPATPTTPATVSAFQNLALIPWEGGPNYWSQFSRANAGGWSNPNFFPIAVWYDGFSSDQEVQYDQSLGINTYTGGLDAGTQFSLLTDNGAYWIGGKVNNGWDTNSPNWVGDFLDDEVDGTASSPASGRAYLQSLVDGLQNDGRFKYTNYTQQVVANYMAPSDARAYVNNYTQAVSIDMYFYTIPYCSDTPYQDPYIVPIGQANCRTSSSYGKIAKALRMQDATDGKLQMIWQFIENLNGGPGTNAPWVYVTPSQIKGSVMSSIINEARGIVYFNQSLSGPYQTGNVFRQSQVDPSFPYMAQINATKQVNALIQQLAPVINTQSYQYSFGGGLDTMLKQYSNSAYIFAMIDGSSQPGSRQFTLPSTFHASSVEVVNESRTLPITNGTFTDSFATEDAYHVYKINI
ncbi:MAG TPA: Ig-like domain-containing protein [Candidatus Microsaccharimonas sp.]|jgi:hypothetical protein